MFMHFKKPALLLAVSITLPCSAQNHVPRGGTGQRVPPSVPPPTVLSIDFRNPLYTCSKPCVVRHDAGTEFNPSNNRSWKMDTYDPKTNAFSFMEIEFSMEKENGKDYALEIQACGRENPPLLSHVTIMVNDHVIARGYHMYNGPDTIHFTVRDGKPDHLRWEVFQVTKELESGKNIVRISLDPETESGISISRFHLRPFQS